MRTKHRTSRETRPLIGKFFQRAQVGLAVLSLDDPDDPGSLRIVAVNEAAARIAALPPGIIGKHAADIPEAAHHDILEDIARVIRDNRPQDLGDIPGLFLPSRMFTVQAFPIPPDSCGLVFEDVTEQRHHARELARAQEMAKMGSWVWDIAANTVTWSPEMYRIYGQSPETFTASFEGFLAAVHPDDRALVQSSVTQALASCRPFHHEERIIRPGGEVRVLDSRGDCVLDQSGKPIQMVGLCRDITDEAHARRALQESEQRFRKIFEASPGAICVFDPQSGRLLDANPRFVELAGYGATAALVGKRLDTLGMWSEPDEFARLIERLRAARSLRETTVTYRTYGGQVRRALVALELIEIDGKETALGLFWRT